MGGGRAEETHHWPLARLMDVALIKVNPISIRLWNGIAKWRPLWPQAESRLSKIA